MKKMIAVLAAATLTLLVALPIASAHVVVKPDTVAIGKYQTFTVSVPNEKDTPTIALKLVLPDGLDSVSPTVKPGWKIDMKDKEIDWTGGSIPVGQRDDFSFSAKTPASAGELDWKAYQTYQDGTVVSWDQNPSASSSTSSNAGESEELTPYSITKVVNDLTAPQNTPVASAPAPDKTTRNIAYAALAVSILAFAVVARKGKA